MLGKKNKDTPVTEITKEDQEWMAKQAMSVFEKRAKKAIKKESKRQITKRDKIKAVVAGVGASAGAMVAYNFAMRKMIQKDLDAKLANKEEIIELVFEEIAKQYPTYIPQGTVINEWYISNLANDLYQDGRQQEAQILLELLNGLNSGTFQVGDIHNFLVNNNLSTVATNMSPSQADIENALYEAYESVYGFNPQGMTDREVIENIIDLHMRPVGEPTDSTLDLYWMFEDLTREQKMQLNKVHEDYILLLNKTTNVHNTNAHNITEAQVDALIQSKQGIWVSPYRGDETTSFVDKLDYVVSQMEWEIAGYAGNPDMQLLLSIQGTMDQGST
ncbi:MAG: hypothetical protein IKC79_00810, partial [Clostridia bacterium]|nr:hypothetical protein [Clostridia bacterium]